MWCFSGLPGLCARPSLLAAIDKNHQLEFPEGEIELFSQFDSKLDS
jgi:hypothetical protein